MTRLRGRRPGGPRSSLAPLVVVPGGPGLSDRYLRDPIQDVFGPEQELIFYDPVGSPSRAPEGPPLEFDRVVAELAGIVEAAADRVALLAHSFGGLVAVQLASERPERVERLLLVDADPLTFADWSQFQEVVQARVREEDRAELARIERVADWQDDPAAAERYVRVLLRPHFGRPALADGLDLGLGSGASRFFTTSRAVRASLGRWDLRPAAGAVAAPVTMLYGEHTVFPRPVVEAMRRSFPAATLRWIEGAGHFPFLEAPDAFIAALPLG